LRPLFGDGEDERAKELRGLIERMGEINLHAIEEYEALDRRYQFLTAQKGDLEQALGQLDEAIARINKTSEQRFREVFELVNARFQEVFPRCFKGGSARLVLTDENNILDSGIEIIAQPPGKKNVTVELLSGGEKAMTAVALIFSIFLIKPSPFCLLDEVDAPLDEANVARFNDLVRELTDRSQFIVITHNKRTMEYAHRLYGITMDEPGISKLVSVNMQRGDAPEVAA
jgi:chromosome segregation protein